MPEEASPPTSTLNSPPSSPPASPPPQSDAPTMEKSAKTRCDCPVLAQLHPEHDSVDEMVHVPAAAHGYLDRQSGKQVGSFMTYVVNFFVRPLPLLLTRG